MGLAYEIVINSNPCIAYLMEENTMTMQALVIAHAAYGHNSFFKGNYLFRQWTNADAIVDYLVFARNYIAQCEERHGEEEVELLLDSCHALMNVGVDRYKRPAKLSLTKELTRSANAPNTCKARSTTCGAPCRPARQGAHGRTPALSAEPQENLLYFIEKNAPLLEPWQREVVRIVRKIGQYFFPQRQTQVMNEGWATFWHYTLINTLYDEGLLSDGFMMEFLHSHTNVVYQPGYNSPGTRASTPTPSVLPCGRTSAASASTPRRRPPLVPRHRRQQLARNLRLRDAQLQGRELHRPVPVTQGDARLPPVRHSR
jgi:stage V sporulation protein R